MSFGNPKPFPKEAQLQRGEKRRGRSKAGRKRWEEIAAKKQGPCRVCGGLPPNELHHLVPRSQGGSDTEANIAPLCRVCHRAVTDYVKSACAALRRNLTDAEYSYCVHVLGEGRFEARFPVEWERA